MKIFKLGLLLTAFAFFIIACNQTSNSSTDAPANIIAVAPTSPEVTPSTVDDLAAARKIYSETCVKCHKEDGKGGFRQIEDVKIKAPDFTSERMKKDEDSEWIEVIKNGEKEDGMPAFKDKLNDDEIKDLVKFIRREFQQK